MKHLSIFTVKEQVIHLTALSDKVTIWFWGDVHRDSQQNCDVDRWKWFLKKANTLTDPALTYYMGLGDYHDFASMMEQKKLKSIGLHQQTMENLELGVQKNNRDIAKEISQMRGKLLGLIEGNHSWVFENGVSSTEDLANRMDTQYLGWLTFFTIKFNMYNQSLMNFHIVACHGKGGGKLLGTSVNQVADMRAIFPSADVYVMGHNHDRGAWPTDILLPMSIPNKPTSLKQKRQFIVRSGSFQKAYEPDRPSYPASKLMRPADLGAIRLTIGFHRDIKTRNYIIDVEAHI